MLLIAWPSRRPTSTQTWPLSVGVLLLCLAIWTRPSSGMGNAMVKSLRDDTRDLFYHGYDNYLAFAFPEDELKPLSCKPQTRNRDDPGDIGLNDVLGNYSVTLVDSLSTLAILASDEDPKHARKAWDHFQLAVKELVTLYGDGSDTQPCGTKACGFDLDSKVQVFETNIRGVGGLLSAHLFAVGELPIRGYSPKWTEDFRGNRYIKWSGFRYNGQLLRLAHDLASRLLPAFSTSTELPYPRVNLRHGIPFYQNAEDGFCRLDGSTANPREITETCSAGAGSLVLEFTTLSRLTGDDRFENLAKRAFYAVWNRRSPLNLIGGGIDAESGQWIMPALAGIGAGIDSFFEYAVKSHILLSGLPYNTSTEAVSNPDNYWDTWEYAHEAVKRHIYRSSSTERHAFYGQSDLLSGAPRYSWIDNLSAYYPGLLVLAGELEEAIESHLLYAALWTRYSALPERWHTTNSFIEPNFKHWAGRPEFIESTYYIYQATKDPWYLHVGEMALRDIRRRCWTKCGWADLGDVLTGEQRDRMESFFLGETAKYLYLLFSEKHPLNTIDAPLVFTTEGHPLIIPKALRAGPRPVERETDATHESRTCPAAPSHLPLTVSHTVNRSDFFHAASLARLHLTPVNPAQSSPILENNEDHAAITIADVRSPTNYTYFPWTLPQSLVPPLAMSSPLRSPILSTLTFPDLTPEGSNVVQKGLIQLGALQKVGEGVLINSLSNVRLNMIQESRSMLVQDDNGGLVEVDVGQEYRIHGIANWALGRDEKVLLSTDALQYVSPGDPHFTRMKDLEMLDLMLDVPRESEDDVVIEYNLDSADNSTMDALWDELNNLLPSLLPETPLEESKAGKRSSRKGRKDELDRYLVPAILPTGAGAAPLPQAMDRDISSAALGRLPYKTMFFLDSELCTNVLPPAIARDYQILVFLRGGCSFSEKLDNIAAFPPGPRSLQLVVMMSIPELHGDSATYGKDGGLIRPLLDKRQTTPNGLERRNPLAMVMVDGNGHNYDLFWRTANAVGTFDSQGKLVEQRVRNRPRTDEGGQNGATEPGLGVKRRYWFESQGVPIGNLMMV